MRTPQTSMLVLVLGISAACTPGQEPPKSPASPASPATPATPPTPASAASSTAMPATPSSGPSPTLCADLSMLVDAARKNFPGLRRQDRPVKIENDPGFEATFVLPGATACRILTSEAPYPDAYECDLAQVASRA